MVSRTISTRPGNLPTVLTRLIDRRTERAEIRRLLGDARLVTLTGPGGVGKTRLAGEELRKAIPDGVWFVDLTTVTEEVLLAATVSYALGMREASDLPAADALATYLRARTVLLVLDNCEHVVAGCARFADALLRSSPGLRVLATSRQPLRIDGEAVFTVHPLPVPGEDSSSRGAAGADAVELFVERARLVNERFRIQGDAYPAVAELCRRLDGLPLAIELAAVRIRAFSPAQLLARVTDFSTVLTDGSRTAPDRQRSLSGSIEWSYRLCDDDERACWHRASVFSGTFDLDAAMAVCGAGPDSRTMALVASLVDKSILIAVEGHDTVRYRMLATIRSFAQGKITSAAERTALRRKHAEWYATLAGDAKTQWISSDQVRYLDRLRADHPNLRAALEFLLSHEETVPRGLRMVTNLHPYWQACGLYEEGRYWLRAALGEYPARDFDRVRALLSLTWLSSVHGSSTVGQRHLAEARSIASELASDDAGALATQASGMQALFTGDAGTAVARFESVLDRFRSSGQLTRQVETLSALAVAHAINGDSRAAARCHEECLALTRERGESWHSSYALWSLALATWHDGDNATARALARESLELKLKLDDRTGIAWCLELLAWITAAERPDAAARLLGAAAALWDTAAPTTLRAVPDLFSLHGQCDRRLRDALPGGYETAMDTGRAASFERAMSWALGTRPQADEGAPPSPPSRLTRRETQVAELVARGKTNREVAESLVISQRTAETHVEHILTKLGFTSRAQIAAWYTDQNP